MQPIKPTKRSVVLKAFKYFGFTLVGNNGRHGNHLVKGEQHVPFPTYDLFFG